MANKLISQPRTSTTPAPPTRSASARSAQSKNSASISSFVRSHGNGANHTCSPASAANSAATAIRAGSAPLIRTAVQCSSSAISRSSRRTCSGSNTGRLCLPPGVNPVS